MIILSHIFAALALIAAAVSIVVLARKRREAMEGWSTASVAVRFWRDKAEKAEAELEEAKRRLARSEDTAKRLWDELRV